MKLKILILPMLLLAMNVYADDFEDGIGSDGISAGGDLKLKKNLTALKRKAKSAIQRQKSGKKSARTEVCGTGNIVIQKGARVKTVVNLSDNRGTITVCEK